MGLKLPLDTYLLKPVQRISKYQLLLKELQKCCNPVEKPHVEQALESMLDVVNNLNDVMHASFIVGCGTDLKRFGRLLKRDQLHMSKVKRSANNKSSSAMNVVNRLKFNETHKCLEVFLFEKAIIICKRKADTDPSAHVNSTPSIIVAAPAHSLATPSITATSSTLVSPSALSVAHTVSAPHSTLSHQNSITTNASLSSSTSPSSTASTSAFTSLFNFQYFYQFKELLMVQFFFFFLLLLFLKISV